MDTTSSFSVMPFPIILVIIVAVIIWALLASARRSAGQESESPRACIRCGKIHPTYANYCRQCGRKLP